MKKYIKNGNVYTTPIKINEEVQVSKIIKDSQGKEKEIKQKVITTTFTNDEKIILENDYEIYQKPQYKRSLDSLIEQSNRNINKETDYKILNEFIYNDEEFYLSIENQFNFKNLYDLREIKKYPVTIKTKNGFMMLNDKYEVQKFYLAGVEFIQKCITDGWQEKITAEQEIRKNYN